MPVVLKQMKNDILHERVIYQEIKLLLFLVDPEWSVPQRVYTTTEFPEIRQTPVPL
jgi:hypothetical protein